MGGGPPPNSVSAAHRLGSGIISKPPKLSGAVMDGNMLRLIEDMNADSPLTEQERASLRHLHEPQRDDCP